MLSMRDNLMGWRHTRYGMGYFGSMKASIRTHGTTCYFAKNFSRRVTRFSE